MLTEASKTDDDDDDTCMKVYNENSLKLLSAAITTLVFELIFVADF